MIGIPSYTPELNPTEKMWHYLKERFKNKTFGDINKLNQTVKTEINNQSVMDIVKSEFYIKIFKSAF